VTENPDLRGMGDSQIIHFPKQVQPAGREKRVDRACMVINFRLETGNLPAIPCPFKICGRWCIQKSTTKWKRYLGSRFSGPKSV